MVLEERDGKRLLFSRDLLEQKRFNETYGNNNWEGCTLRAWLNNEFMQTAFTEEEKEQARAVIARAKELRDLVQKGTFYRLLSPAGAKYAAWQFVGEDGKQALLCVYRILSEPNVPPVRVRMAGLDPDAVYRDETGKLYSGSTLMYMGFSARIPGDFGSCVVLLEKVEETE